MYIQIEWYKQPEVRIIQLHGPRALRVPDFLTGKEHIHEVKFIFFLQEDDVISFFSLSFSSNECYIFQEF